MLKRWLSKLGSRPPAVQQRCAECPLAACASGCRIAVLRMGCEQAEAGRLRTMGLFEGACATVVEAQGGMLLDVSGSRLAVGPALARTITVLPLTA